MPSTLPQKVFRPTETALANLAACRAHLRDNGHADTDSAAITWALALAASFTRSKGTFPSIVPPKKSRKKSSPAT